MTDHFDESIMTGTRQMSGSAAIRLRKRTIAASESSMASSMLTSIIRAPFSTCSRAISSAVSKSPATISLRNFAEPVTLVRSPTMTKRWAAFIAGASPATGPDAGSDARPGALFGVSVIGG